MMKQVLKIELRRAFTSRGMFLALLIGSALAVYHCITEVLPMAETVAYYTSPEMLATPKIIFYPDFLYFTWVGRNHVPYPAHNAVFYDSSHPGRRCRLRIRCLRI